MQIHLNRLTRNSKLMLAGLSMWLPFFLHAQQITLDQAYEMARRNYPLIKQKDLIRQTADITIGNLSKGYLPQINFTSQASYQSEVTRVDIPIPGIKVPTLDKDQYKVIVGDLNQVIYDGGVIKSQQRLQELNAAVEDQKVEVELYKLQDRVSQVYLGVLYLDAQSGQVELMKQDLQIGIRQVDAQVRNGVSLRSNLDVLKAELLKTEQREIELKAGRKGLIDILGLLINQSLDEHTQLAAPAPTRPDTNTLNRPEIKLFSDQSKLFLQQRQLIHARNLPRASLFVQGGYAKPALNLFKNTFEWYYIGGVRLNWSLSGLYTSRKEKQLADLNTKGIDIQKETFVLNTNTQLKQQESEIEKAQQLIATDHDIIALRKSVKDAAKAQLENGVITANDYLREVNAEDMARQTLITHQLQLLQARINYQTILGK